MEGDLAKLRGSRMVYIRHFKNSDHTEKRVKGYFLIITCCCTRAVHIALTPDLSVKFFLLAFRRFISRCSITQNIINNIFKTFFMPYLRIKWNIILEKSPWWGRFYERMVLSIKNTLFNSEHTGWLAHLVSRLPCNTRMLVEASSNPPVSCV